MTSYSNVQKQQLGQLGAYLQEKRQEQGKSVEDISLQTYIRAQLIKAVESGDTTDLPQPIFVQGFIRRYADALGLDGSNFAKQFPVHSIPNTPRPTPRPATQINIPATKSSTGQEASKPLTLAEYNQRNPEEQPLVGALPIQDKPAESPKVEPPKMEPPKVESTAPDTPKVPDGVVAKQADIEKAAFKLDSKPMGESELNALGLSTPLGDGITLPKSGASSPEPDMPASLGGGNTTWSSSADFSRPSSSGGGSWLSWLPWGIGAALLVGAIALIVPRFMGNGTGEPSEPIQAEAPEEVVEAETPPPAPEPAPEPEPEPAAAVSDAPVSLAIEVTDAGPSWMSIEVDGATVFEGMVDPGTKELWEGQQSITMNVGNAGATLISANGSEPTPAGEPGDVNFLTFTAEGE